MDLNQNKGGEETTPDAPSKVVINGTEYEASEVQDLMDVGRKTREYEKQANTSLDKVWPEYTRLSQERSQWETDKKKYEEQIKAFQDKKDAGTETPDDIRKAQEAARKLNIILGDDLEKRGYMTKEQIDQYLEERDKTKAEVNEVLSSADALENEINGEDGRPKFNKKLVLAYINAYPQQGASYKDKLINGYNEMYNDQLKTWQNEQINAKKTGGLKTVKGTTGKKEPKPIQIDDKNVGKILHEVLDGGHGE